MAAQMRAELCATLPQADATLADRAALPPIDLTTLTTLQVLARRVARAERIAVRTRERAVADVSRRLAGADAALAIHPTTIRERAAAVDEARAALTGTERALAEHEAEAEAAERTGASAGGDDPPGADPADVGIDAPAGSEGGPVDATEPSSAPSGTPPDPASMKAHRSRALGTIVAAFGLAMVVLGIGLVPLWAALLLPLAASLWAMRHLRPRDEEDAADRQEASHRLAEIGATADQLFGARRAGQELADRGALLRASRDRAEEELRVAERAWHELAGAGVDVSELEEVVKRFDPQHEDARLLAGETIGVRTAEVVLHQFRQRWLAFWRELGLAAPDAAHGEQAVDELGARLGRPIVLVGPATARGAELARVAPAAPVVVLHGPADDERQPVEDR
jgi:hypothetical protein